MPHLLLTDKVLEKADPAKSPKGRLELWDTYLPGFGYRATQRGKGSFFVMFRQGGRRQRLGTPPPVVPQQRQQEAWRPLHCAPRPGDRYLVAGVHRVAGHGADAAGGARR